MASELRGLRTLIYPSSDLHASTAWWRNFLGTDPYFEEPFYVGFSVAGYELGLVPVDDPSGGATAYWAVDDVEACIADALASGASVREPAHDVGEGIVVGAVESPHGDIIGFIVNPHFHATN
jgi:hypothetical protein